MKKYLLTIMALLLMTATAFATQVEVTMNAKSKLIKSLVNMTTSESVQVGEPVSDKYTFDAADGSYLLTATAADGWYRLYLQSEGDYQGGCCGKHHHG